MASDFYTYRKEVKSRRSRKRGVLVVLGLLLILSAVAGGFWFWKGQGTPASAVQATPEEAQATAEPTPTPTPVPETQATAESAGFEARRLLPEVDTASWDKSEKVEATLNQDYQNTDHRMVALPMLGTVTDDYFNTVTFVGDSLNYGLGIYVTGYQNSLYAAY